MAHKGTSVVLYRSKDIRCAWVWQLGVAAAPAVLPCRLLPPLLPVTGAPPPHLPLPTRAGLPTRCCTALYRRRHQYTSITDWTGGLYISPGFAGSRSGALIATAWAALVHLGEEGYLAATGGRPRHASRSWHREAVAGGAELAILANGAAAGQAVRPRTPSTCAAARPTPSPVLPACPACLAMQTP